MQKLIVDFDCERKPFQAELRHQRAVKRNRIPLESFDILGLWKARAREISENKYHELKLDWEKLMN